MKRPNIDRCRDLRKNQTYAEGKLWSILRNRRLAGAKFRRQFAIGRYILDFYSPQYKLAIEADGGQHYEDKGRRRDELRTRELSLLGVEVLRFSDREILNNIQGICEIVRETIEKKAAPHLNPLPRGERKKDLGLTSRGKETQSYRSARSPNANRLKGREPQGNRSGVRYV